MLSKNELQSTLLTHWTAAKDKWNDINSVIYYISINFFHINHNVITNLHLEQKVFEKGLTERNIVIK